MAPVWHWREDAPIERLPPRRALLVEEIEPYRLHLGFDGWQNTAEIASEPLGLGLCGVRLDAALLAGHGALDFTRFFSGRGTWEGVDHRVALRSG